MPKISISRSRWIWLFIGVITMPELTYLRGTLGASRAKYMKGLILANITRVSSMFRSNSHIICIGKISWPKVTEGMDTFRSTPNLVQPPSTGTDIRNGSNATAGTWTNPDPCPPAASTDTSS